MLIFLLEAMSLVGSYFTISEARSKRICYGRVWTRRWGTWYWATAWKVWMRLSQAQRRGFDGGNEAIYTVARWATCWYKRKRSSWKL